MSFFASITLESVLVACAVLVGFVAFLFVGSMVLPGQKLQGVELKDGTRKTYVLNGLWLFLVTAATAIGGYATGVLPLHRVVELFPSLLVAANLLAVIMTGILFVQGRRKRAADDPEKNSSAAQIVRDLWLGAELNPTWFGVDMKMFSYRPSLIGLAILNLSFAALQLETYGELSAPMMLYQAFTFIYVFNYFQFEYGMVFTWDIIAERFGFMLVWGDYVLVPFFYCISAWALVHHTVDLPWWQVVVLSTLFLFGFWLFRGANEQKHRFKMDRNAVIWGKKAETIGDRLLVSGFWGIGRHLNYTGEICVYLAWTFTTGFTSIWPFLLPGWLICLLSHRAWRDDKRCREKYGELWVEYTRRARFKMVPFIY